MKEKAAGINSKWQIKWQVARTLQKSGYGSIINRVVPVAVEWFPKCFCLGPRSSRSEAAMFAGQGIAAQHRGWRQHFGSPATAWSGAAVADCLLTPNTDDAVSAFVWLKACVSSKGRLVAFDVLAVYPMLYVGSLWVREACCLTCDFLKLLNCKRMKKSRMFLKCINGHFSVL